MNKVDNRRVNFELLRVISMILIILYHMVLYGVYDGGLFNSYRFSYALFMAGGKIGVILFIMITGFFMCNKDIKLFKLVKLEGQVLFYSILSLIIFMIIGNRPICGNDIAKTFFPNLLNTYWFYSSYFALFLFIPFINKIVKELNAGEFRKLLILGFVFLILIPSLIIYNRPITNGVYLLYYYLLGSYIRIHGNKLIVKTRYLILGIIFSYIMMILCSYLLFNLSLINSNLSSYVFCVTNISSIFVFFVSILIFILFMRFEICNFKIINFFGSVSFGVYLFHDNFFMREILWNDIFKVSLWSNNCLFIVYGLIIAFVIYFIFGIVEYFRKLIIDRLLFDKIYNKLLVNKR